jgi:hypothetical protein
MWFQGRKTGRDQIMTLNELNTKIVTCGYEANFTSEQEKFLEEILKKENKEITISFKGLKIYLYTGTKKQMELISVEEFFWNK